MAKFIDLDQVRKPVGEFTLGGKQYTVWPLRIEQIINLSVDTPDAGTGTQEEQFRRLVTGLHEAIPDCPEDELSKMDMVQFNALSAWIQSAGAPDEKNESPPPALALPEPTAA